MTLQKSIIENQHIDFSKTYISNEGSKFKILYMVNTKRILIEFLDIYKHTYWVQLVNIKNGQVKNPYHKSILGIGFIGYGIYKVSYKRKCTKIYDSWKGIIERAYSEKLHKRHPSYIGCSVSEKWHNFQNFAAWFEKNYIDGYALDKDILMKGNRTYSPETCCFIPQRINTLILNNKRHRGVYPIGVNRHGKKFQSSCNTSDGVTHIGTFDTPEEAFFAYKNYKENLIVTVAKEYLKNDLISFEVFKALLEYKIEITD